LFQIPFRKEGVALEKQNRNAEPIAYGVDGVIDLLGGNISPGLIRLEIKRGKLRSTKVGRRVLVLRTELLRYLAANAEQSE
jgi:hypothetical protein